MNHLDLFSGYGGFTIPASKYGIKTIYFSEIDKYANSVLKYRFPNIPNLGDVTKINAKDLQPIDIITGGSPCQDLSVAGKGAGLNGARSGLFFCFINLIKEKQPMYFVWENVKGALSSSRGWDFARVQIEMEQAGYDVWWQLINAKDFGVPQNRERIFAIGIRKGSGREILFEQRESKQDIKKYGDLDSETWKKRNESIRRVYSPEGIAPTTPTAQGGGVMTKIVEQGGRDQQYINGKIKRARKFGSSGSFHRPDEIVSTTSTYYKGIGNAERPGVIVHNLQPRSPNRPSLLKNKNAGGSGHLQREDGITYTVDTGGTQGVDLGDMRIRRLTPTECERLMGLEDGWTAKGIIDGKEVDISDTQRYKLCGNGVVVNCVDYIYNLISKTL